MPKRKAVKKVGQVGIRVQCHGCNHILRKPGGLLFSPPVALNQDMVHKMHLCTSCYDAVMYHLYQQ